MKMSNSFKLKRKESVFSHIPSSYVEKEGDKIKFQSKARELGWAKITHHKVIVTKIINSSGQVKIKNNNGKEYIGSEGIGNILNGLHFYSWNSADAIEYAIITSVKSPSSLPPYQSYSGITEGYWKDLQPKGTYCLILKMEAGNFIRNSGKNGEELNADAINKEFLILDGIDYKSNNADHTLIYMVI